MFVFTLCKYSITLQTLQCSTIVFSFFSWSFYPLGAHFWSFLLLSSIYIQVEAELSLNTSNQRTGHGPLFSEEYGRSPPNGIICAYLGKTSLIWRQRCPEWDRRDAVGPAKELQKQVSWEEQELGRAESTWGEL